MPLYFVKPKRWPPSRPVQFILAFLALLIVLALLAIWLFIGYRQSISPNVPDQSDTSLPVSAEPIAGVGNTLLILQQEQQTQTPADSAANSGIAAIGFTFILLVGQLDISFGSVISLTACVFMMLLKAEVSFAVAVLVALAVV